MAHHIDHVVSGVWVFELVADLEGLTVLLQTNGPIDEILETGEWWL